MSPPQISLLGTTLPMGCYFFQMSSSHWCIRPFLLITFNVSSEIIPILVQFNLCNLVLGSSGLEIARVGEVHDQEKKQTGRVDSRVSVRGAGAKVLGSRLAFTHAAALAANSCHLSSYLFLCYPGRQASEFPFSTEELSPRTRSKFMLSS